MDKVNVAIVEDEFIISQDMETSLTALGYNVTAVYDSGAKAIAGIKSYPPDILLMDINIKGELDGIETIRLLQEFIDIPFIYISAYSDNKTVTRAKHTKPHAYIVKPFDFNNLGPTIETAIYNYATGNQGSITNAHKPLNIKDSEIITNKIIFIKDKKKLIRLATADIICLCAKGSYCQINTENKSFIISNNLQHVLEKLNADFLIRIHRSHAININHIDSINEDSVQLKDLNLPISKGYRASLLDRISYL